MNMNEPPSLLRNDYGADEQLARGEARRHARRTGRPSARPCASPLAGARQARAVLSQSSYYSHDDLRAHFGLGPALRADRNRRHVAERHR